MPAKRFERDPVGRHPGAVVGQARAPSDHRSDGPRPGHPAQPLLEFVEHVEGGVVDHPRRVVRPRPPPANLEDAQGTDRAVANTGRDGALAGESPRAAPRALRSSFLPRLQRSCVFGAVTGRPRRWPCTSGEAALCRTVTTLAVAVMHDALRVPCGRRHVRRFECEPRAQCMGRHAADDPPWPSVQWKGAEKVVRCGLDEREVPPVTSGGLGQRCPPRWP